MWIDRSHPHTKSCKNPSTWKLIMMEQKHARAAQKFFRTHPSFSKLTWSFQSSSGIMTSYRTDSRTDTNRDFDSTYSSAQKTGSSKLWRIHVMSRIVCYLANAWQQIHSSVEFRLHSFQTTNLTQTNSFHDC